MKRFAFSVVVVALCATASAVDLYWDGGNATANGVLNSGSGNWNQTSPFWTTSPTDAVAHQAWVDGNTANFGGTPVAPSTVTITQTVTPDGINFLINGYTIAASGGNTLNVNFLSNIFVAASNITATISAPISGAGGLLTKDGAGTLILSSNGSTFTDGLAIFTGTVLANANGALGSGGLSIGTGVTFGSGVSGVVLPNEVFVGGDFSVSPTGTLTFSNTFHLLADSVITKGNNAGTVVISGPLVEDVLNSALTFSGGNGTPDFRISGSQANSYTGITTVDGGSLVELAKTGAGLNTAIPGNLVIADGTVALANNDQIADAAVVTMGAAGNLDLGGFNETVRALSGATGATIFLNEGTLTLSSNTSDTQFAGNIVDGSDPDGALIIDYASGHTAFLSGNNTFTGATIIVGGTLQLGSATALSPNAYVDTVSAGVLDLNGFNASAQALLGDKGSRVLLNGGVLTLQGNTFDTAFGGDVIDGAHGGGGITVNYSSGFEAVFSGVNTYSGATTINGGTFTAASPTALSPHSVFIVNSAGVLNLSGYNNTIGSLSGSGAVINNSATAAVLTTGHDNSDTEFSGSLLDGGAGRAIGRLGLEKIGTGTFVLSGNNTFSGGTSLRAGALAVASDHALGTGNVVVSGGTLRASSSPRSIVVRGNYQQSGGELALRIGGTADNQYDRLAVTGSASLGGRLRVGLTGGFKPAFGQKFTAVTAEGGVNGKFAEVAADSAAPLLALVPSYESDRVILQASQAKLTEVLELQGNALAVARAIDAVSDHPRAAKLARFLSTLTLDQIPDALDRVSPEEVGSIFEMTRSGAKVAGANIDRRADEIHAAGASGAGGPAGSPDGKSKEIVAPQQYRWGTFANGSGEFVDVGDTTGARGYNLKSGGVTLGVDYKVTDHFVIGLLIGYTRAHADLFGSGRIDADTFRSGIYSTIFSGGAYLNGFLGGAYNSYDSKREGLGGNPTGDTNGGEFNAVVAAGYDAHLGHLTVGPTVSYQYTYTDVGGFDERGSLAPLHIDSSNGESSRFSLGARASYDLQVGGFTLRPELRMAWQHEFGDVAQTTSARFPFAGSSFSVTSPEVGRDSLLLGAGLGVVITPQVTGYAYYDGELGRENYDAHNVTLGVRAEF